MSKYIFTFICVLFVAWPSYGQGLPSNIVSNMTKQFDGSIISMQHSDTQKEAECQPRTYEIERDGSVEIDYRVVCKQKDGSWLPFDSYKMQILTSDNKVVIVTVDKDSGEVLKVER